MFQLQPAAWTGLDTYIGDGLVVVPGTAPPWLNTGTNGGISVLSQGFAHPGYLAPVLIAGDTITIQTMRGKVRTFQNPSGVTQMVSRAGRAREPRLSIWLLPSPASAHMAMERW